MQNTAQLMMIQPVNFGFNAETAVNNGFQHKPDDEVQEKALEEFLSFADLLIKNNIGVTVVADSHKPHTPDAIFPNNWFSTGDGGRIYIYPMFAPNRRQERKQQVLDALINKFEVKEVIDLSVYEINDMYLEGTGSMVLDRVNRIVYACISPRTSPAMLDEFCKLSAYKSVVFTATDSSNINIYHTNVMMCVANDYAVVCLEAIRAGDEREKLKASLAAAQKTIIGISLDQLGHFAGNMLQVRNTEGELLLIMSTRAFESLTADQIKTLEKYNRIIHAPLNTIESTGGGSARCMLAEIFLEKK